jgi:preprotein translocase subunit SecA
MQFIKNIFSSSNQRYLNKAGKILKKINSLEATYENLSEAEFKNLHAELLDKYKDQKDLIAHAFAAVREASKRTLAQRHFDSQMLGGIALSEGNISEMKTGEGKTLVGTLPSYLNFIQKKKVILVTVNDYLAQRDAEWMRPVYEYLGMKVGIIFSNQDLEEKKVAYSSDVIYATNNELGFDYLRDNMALRISDKVQCSLDFAVIDEVDSILIDEARTPLIISGPSNESPEYYIKLKKIIPSLKKQLREGTEEEPLLENEIGDYFVDEKNRSVDLTDRGYEKIESFLENEAIISDSESLYSASNLKIMRYVQATLRANFLFKRDVHYLVRDGEILLIDEHTGRTMPGRRISEGVHQAIEAKENVNVQRESQTLASTTFQNFFRLFETLSGMTGTADTEAREFQEIYGLNVVIIPTHKKMIRIDNNDLVFLSKEAKFKALLDEIVSIREKKAPILIGTASVESSEEVSDLLRKNNVPHQVLNAKNHAKEAEIIANAGKPSSVTIATNMAGRGTDIVLGGKSQDKDLDSWKLQNNQVLDSGGLHILGTERHESRRIDNQLRGRAGRQGDPGYSKFFLSLEDDLLRLFISDGRRSLFEKIGMGEDHIEHRMLSRGIENAQKRIEGRNFDLRKNLLEYDDVSNDQRQAVYSLRDQLLEETKISDSIEELIEDEFSALSYEFIPPESVESQWQPIEMEEKLKSEFKINLNVQTEIINNPSWQPLDISNLIINTAKKFYKDKFDKLGGERSLLEKQVMLQVLDNHWKDHLAEMDHLRQNIGLRAYAQKNPKNEFKREAYEMFEYMLEKINSETVRILFNLELISEEAVKDLQARAIADQKKMQEKMVESQEINNPKIKAESQQEKSTQTIVRESKKIGRNEPCHCGSGKKYKQCCGK